MSRDFTTRFFVEFHTTEEIKDKIVDAARQLSESLPDYLLGDLPVEKSENALLQKIFENEDVLKAIENAIDDSRKLVIKDYMDRLDHEIQKKKDNIERLREKIEEAQKLIDEAE